MSFQSAVYMDIGYDEAWLIIWFYCRGVPGVYHHKIKQNDENKTEIQQQQTQHLRCWWWWWWWRRMKQSLVYKWISERFNGVPIFREWEEKKKQPHRKTAFSQNTTVVVIIIANKNTIAFTALWKLKIEQQQKWLNRRIKKQKERKKKN